jgi:hypothetical protein
MDAELKQIYYQYKSILSGCRTIYDSLYFAQDIINKNPKYKNFINGMIHGKTYEKILDFRSVAHTLNTLNELPTRNDINEYINNNLKDNYDIIQVGTFMRLGKNKNILLNNDNKIYKLNNNIDTHNDSHIDIINDNAAENIDNIDNIENNEIIDNNENNEK